MAGRPRCRGDTGAVTVEAAISIGALVAVLALVFGGIAAVTDQLRCTDAAREAARLAARGDRDGAREAVAAIAPAGATLELLPDGDGLTAIVRAAPVGGLLPGLRIEGRAFAVTEPGAGATARSPGGADP